MSWQSWSTRSPNKVTATALAAAGLLLTNALLAKHTHKAAPAVCCTASKPARLHTFCCPLPPSPHKQTLTLRLLVWVMMGGCWRLLLLPLSTRSWRHCWVVVVLVATQAQVVVVVVTLQAGGGVWLQTSHCRGETTGVCGVCCDWTCV